MDIQRWDAEPVEQMNAKIGRQMIHTETMTLARVILQQGAVVPEHEHPNEQIATVVEGRMRFGVGGEDYVVSAGETIAFPANVAHDAEALEDSVVFDAFSPPRDDWRRGEDAYLRR